MRKELLFLHKNNEAANGILEMLVCIPIAIVFLFVAIDVGLSFLDRAMITDAVRETVHEYAPSQYSNVQNPMFRVQPSGIELDNDSILDFTSKISNRFQAIVAERRVSLGSSSSLQDVRIIVTPLRLLINTQSGEIESYEKMSALGSTAGNTQLLLGSKVQKVSEDEYLTTAFSSAFQGTYAIPAVGFGGANERYLPQSLGVLVSVEAVSPAINPSLLELVLGSTMGIQVQEFQLVRN